MENQVHHGNAQCSFVFTRREIKSMLNKLQLLTGFITIATFNQSEYSTKSKYESIWKCIECEYDRG